MRISKGLPLFVIFLLWIPSMAVGFIWGGMYTGAQAGYEGFMALTEWIGE